MKNENYIAVFGWMVNELGLKDKELFVYALIYGFSQDGISRFTGSHSYIAKWLGCSRQTVINIIKSLCKKKLIIKIETEVANNIKLCSYRANLDMLKNFTPSKEIIQGVSNNLTEGCKEILHNNKYINTKYNNKPSFNDFNQRNYDMESLERMLTE